MVFSFRPVFTASLALLIFLVLPSPSVVVAQQQDDKKATTLLTSDDDKTTDTDSFAPLLLTNYNALREEGQGFYLHEMSFLYEKPDNTEGSFVAVEWWCDLEFSSEDANNYGYVGRAVRYILGSSLEDILADGAQKPNENRWPVSVSAVLVPTLGILEGQFHVTHDDQVHRYWDDGSSTLPIIAWEGHDEGGTSPKADTSAWSGSGTLTKITPEAAAELLGMEVADMTPATCTGEYEAAWNATHVPDPIDTSLTELEETVAQLQADNRELLSRIVAIEGGFSANGGGGGGGGDGEAPATSASPFMMAAFEPVTMDSVMKPIMTVTVIIGLLIVN